MKSRIAMAKALFDKKKAFCISKLDLNLRKTLINCYIWSIALCRAETGDTSERRFEIPGKF